MTAPRTPTANRLLGSAVGSTVRTELAIGVDDIAQAFADIEAEAAPDVERLIAALKITEAALANIDVTNSAWTDSVGALHVVQHALSTVRGPNRVTVVMPEGSTFTPGPGLTPLDEASREPGEEG